MSGDETELNNAPIAPTADCRAAAATSGCSPLVLHHQPKTQ